MKTRSVIYLVEFTSTAKAWFPSKNRIVMVSGNIFATRSSSNWAFSA